MRSSRHCERPPPRRVRPTRVRHRSSLRQPEVKGEHEAPGAVDWDTYVDRQSHISGDSSPGRGRRLGSPSRSGRCCSHWSATTVSRQLGGARPRTPPGRVREEYSGPPPGIAAQRPTQGWRAKLEACASRRRQPGATDGASATSGTSEWSSVASSAFRVYAGCIAFTSRRLHRTSTTARAEVDQPGAAEGPGPPPDVRAGPDRVRISPPDVDARLHRRPFRRRPGRVEKLGGRRPVRPPADEVTLGEPLSARRRPHHRGADPDADRAVLPRVGQAATP